MEAIAAMIGSATTSEEEEREIQIVEIFNQDVAKNGLGRSVPFSAAAARA